ncbi:hypothetical protein B566_EDAN018238, partial [Ephemera danica]
MRVVVTLVFVLVAGSLAYHLIPPEAAANHKPIRDFLVQEAKGKAGVFTCTLCRQFVDATFGWVEAGLTDEEVIIRLTNMCFGLGVFTERVCRGAVEINY